MTVPRQLTNEQAAITEHFPASVVVSGTIMADDILVYPDGTVRRPNLLVGCEVANYSDIVKVLRKVT